MELAILPKLRHPCGIENWRICRRGPSLLPLRLLETVKECWSQIVCCTNCQLRGHKAATCWRTARYGGEWSTNRCCCYAELQSAYKGYFVVHQRDRRRFFFYDDSFDASYCQ